MVFQLLCHRYRGATDLKQATQVNCGTSLSFGKVLGQLDEFRQILQLISLQSPHVLYEILVFVIEL